jgi:hypothetical protein
VSKRATYNLMFNAVGALLVLTVIGYVAWSLFQFEREEPCRGRYPAPTRFSLTTAAGAPLSPIELQGRAGQGAWGVLDNAKVVSVPEPPGTALEVKLAPVASEVAHSSRNLNGIDFRWLPLGMKVASAVCFDYSVFIPEKFPFSDEGGVLPGVFGTGAPTAAGSEPTKLGARLQWGGDAKGILYVAPSGAGFRGVNLGGFPLVIGRWTRIQQEIVLNAPGEANGIARLWADGELKAEDKGLDLRKDKGEGLNGVTVDVGYLVQPGAGAAPSLKFSPLEISWR